MVAHASSLALGSADAEEGVGAPELVAGVGLDGDALLADGVAVLLDVVAGVEPREGEVAVGAALELTRVDVDGLALDHGCISITFSFRPCMSAPATKQVSSDQSTCRCLTLIKEEELTTHTIFFCHGCEDPHDQGGLQAQEHQERAALHGRFAWRFSSLFPVETLCVLCSSEQ